MTANRRRRVRPSPKPAEQPRRRKRRVSKPLDWRGSLINMAIGALIMLMLFLLVSTVRQRLIKKPVTTVVTNEQPQAVTEPENRPLQVDVLNGCGVSGLAAQFTEYLRMKGFDVIRTENYETFNVLETVVIDRRGNAENCRRIAGTLGLSSARILQEVNEAYLIDATVLIVKDYQRLSSWPQMGKTE